MTNYNERLDEIFDLPNIIRMVKEKGSDVSDIDKHIQLRVVFYDGKHQTYPTTLSYDLSKQAITSLIKELVAEAKPYRETIIDKWNRDRVDEVKATNAAMNAWADIYEQNLLKAFEEV